MSTDYGCCWFPLNAFRRGPRVEQLTDPEQVRVWADATFDGRPFVSVPGGALPVSIGQLHHEAERRGYESWGTSGSAETGKDFDFRKADQS